MEKEFSVDATQVKNWTATFLKNTVVTAPWLLGAVAFFRGLPIGKRVDVSIRLSDDQQKFLFTVRTSDDA